MSKQFLQAIVGAVLFSAVSVQGEIPKEAKYEKISPTLINGTPVDPGTWPEVIRIRSGTSGCSATIVGPRAILTAAHCANNGATATFTYKGANYSAKITRSPIWPAKDQDVAIGILSSDIPGVTPHIIGGEAKVKTEITLLGYGCIHPPSGGGGVGTGGNDGILRIGKSTIVSFSSYDMVSRSGGAALCQGDSGGPAFVQVDGKYLLLGVNSKGNIRDTNYNTRTDMPETVAFFKKVSADNGGVVICGITDPCSSTPAPEPTCTLTANPSVVPLNGSLALMLKSQNAVSADIDGTSVNVPEGEKRLNPDKAGTFKAVATVRNADAKTATCSAEYTVKQDDPVEPERPSCTVTAIPSVAKIGETIVLEISAKGKVDYASIDGNSVSVPVGRLNVNRTAVGDYSATGFVRGAGGSANCFGEYRIEDGTVPPPIAEFAITPTHCGANVFPQSGIQSACLAVVKTDPSWQTTVSRVVLVNNVDKSQEVLPILASNSLASGVGSSQATDQFVVYGGKSLAGSAVPVLDTRAGKLTRLIAGNIPKAVEGRSPNAGRLYLVKALSEFDVGKFLPVLNEAP